MKNNDGAQISMKNTFNLAPEIISRWLLLLIKKKLTLSTANI